MRATVKANVKVNDARANDKGMKVFNRSCVSFTCLFVGDLLDSVNCFVFNYDYSRDWFDFTRQDYVLGVNTICIHFKFQIYSFHFHIEAAIRVTGIRCSRFSLKSKKRNGGAMIKIKTNFSRRKSLILKFTIF
jgi:hypothetical protein